MPADENDQQQTTNWIAVAPTATAAAIRSVVRAVGGFFITVFTNLVASHTRRRVLCDHARSFFDAPDPEA
jgi:hypothetical protein